MLRPSLSDELGRAQFIGLGGLAARGPSRPSLVTSGTIDSNSVLAPLEITVPPRFSDRSGERMQTELLTAGHGDRRGT